MAKKLRLLIFVIFYLFLSSLSAQESVTDFFLDPSKEKDLLAALFESDESQNELDKPFTLDAEAGVLLTSGNTESRLVKLAFDSSHELDKWSNRYEVNILERQNVLENEISGIDENITTNRIEVSAQFDYKLSNPEHRLFGYLEFDDNQFNLLRNQMTVVAGWSQVLWQKEKSSLRYSIGPGYSSIEQERTSTTIDEFIARGSFAFHYAISEHARIYQSLSAELGDKTSTVRGQLSLTAKVFDKLAMKLGVEISFNDGIAEQENAYSTQTSISMVYHFF